MIPLDLPFLRLSQDNPVKGLSSDQGVVCVILNVSIVTQSVDWIPTAELSSRMLLVIIPIPSWWCSSSPMSRSLVLILLVIGGVEQNPGPLSDPVLTQLLQQFQQMNARLEHIESNVQNFSRASVPLPFSTNGPLAASFSAGRRRSPRPGRKALVWHDPTTTSTMHPPRQSGPYRSQSNVHNTQRSSRKARSVRIPDSQPPKRQLHVDPTGPSYSRRRSLSSGHSRGSSLKPMKGGGVVGLPTRVTPMQAKPQPSKKVKGGKSRNVRKYALPEYILNEHDEVVALCRSIRETASLYQQLVAPLKALSSLLASHNHLVRLHLIQVLDCWTEAQKVTVIRYLPAPPFPPPFRGARENEEPSHMTSAGAGYALTYAPQQEAPTFPLAASSSPAGSFVQPSPTLCGEQAKGELHPLVTPSSQHVLTDDQRQNGQTLPVEAFPYVVDPYQQAISTIVSPSFSSLQGFENSPAITDPTCGVEQVSFPVDVPVSSEVPLVDPAQQEVYPLFQSGPTPPETSSSAGSHARLGPSRGRQKKNASRQKDSIQRTKTRGCTPAGRRATPLPASELARQQLLWTVSGKPPLAPPTAPSPQAETSSPSSSGTSSTL